jgi:3-dehydroquinate dehydratase/shikimate dehydrogenase
LHQFVISIVGPDTESAITDMRTAAGSCDLFELRLDRIRDADLPRLIEAAPKHVIATCRPVHEGGAFAGTDTERLSLLSQAGGLGARYIDIEFGSAAEFDPRGAKLIISYHNFSRVPDDIREIHQHVCGLKPAVAKLACSAKGAQDNMAMMRLNRGAPVPTAAFCMGKVGLPSRVLGRKYGARLTYAALEAASAAAPGQPTIALLADTYRARSVRSRTAVYGVLGNPALHSVGPVFHNGAFEALGKDAVYLPFETAEPDAFWSAFSGEVRGLSVTTPHKRKALEFVRKVSPEAQAVGAVNTLVRTRGGFNGFNTDIEGVRKPLIDRLGTLGGRTVLVLGAGGAAAAAVQAVISEGARASVSNRTEAKAEKLTERFDVEVIPWEERAGAKCDIVINATTVGLRGEEMELLPAEFFSPSMIAFDLVYHRGGTAFLRAASAAGAGTIDGIEMFIAQAVEQLRLWTGGDIPGPLVAELAMKVRKELSA